MKPQTFNFESYAFDAATGALRLRYAFDTGQSFEETIHFPPPFAAYDTDALDRVFRLLFLLAGVSYYKAYAPEKLVCNAFPLDSATARWLEKVYESGLGEFAYRNNLDLCGKIHFADTPATEAQKPLSLSLPEKLLVPIGGGKDSVVTLETLRRAGHNVTCFALGGTGGPAAPIAGCIRISGLPHISVARTIAPQLIELNKTGVYNGHVPITAILSTIALATALLYGFCGVVMSNEHSASAPNFMQGSFAVNHQYSKSFEFEQDLAAYIANRISPDLAYFSFLRPLGEIDITRRFARLVAYHDMFRSCNTAFRQNVSERGTNWCGHCPKCHFVYLALAPFLEKQKLAGIFGANLLDDASQIAGFAALCGMGADKPFECVGETEESAAVLKKLAAMPQWQNDAVIKALAPKLPEIAFEKLFTRHAGHAVPPKYLEALDAP